MLNDFSILSLIFIFITGLAFGSFASVVTSRLLKEEGIFLGRSKCPSCQRRLTALELIPVFSWLLQKGRCKGCGKNIKIFYPALELATALLFSIIYFRFGLTVEFFLFCAVGFILLLIIIIDLESMIIPDELQIVLLILAFTNIFVKSDLQEGLLNSFVGGCAGVILGLGLRFIFLHWKKKEALGMGDVKFLVVAGIFLGPYTMLPFIFIAGILGVVSSMLWRFKSSRPEFPFAPALAVSLFICLTVPQITQVFWKIYGI